MINKYCDYKGCENSRRCGKPRFIFPKNEFYKKLWILNSGNSFSEKLSNGQHMFLCADHFERKFLSWSRYRKRVSTVAIPFSFESKNCETPKVDEENLNCDNFEVLRDGKQTKMNPIKLLKNQNNGTNLQYKEYQYHKSKNFMTDDGLIQYWVCQHRLKTDPIALPSQKKRYLNCSATMHTLEKDGQISVKKEPTDHSCSVIDAIQKARETFIAEIRNIAATSSEKPAEIIQNYKATKTIEELKYLPSDKALIRSIQRYQKRIIQQSSDENPEATTSHKASNQKNALNHNVKNEENEFNGTDTQSRTDEINTTHQNITQQNENGGNKVDITTSRKRRLQVDNLEGKLEDALQCIKSMQNKIAKRDEHSIFGELIAHNIRICNPSKKEIAIAQHHIENVIFNLTMGVYSKRGSSHLGSTDSYNFTESTENLQHTFDRVVTKTEPYL